MKSAQQRRSKTMGGFTVVELLVVLVLLVSVVALTISVSGATWETAQRGLSTAQLTEARKAVLQFERDCLRWPTRISELVVQPQDLPEYQPTRGTGWRGPYLSPVRGVYALDLARNFTLEVAQVGDPVPLDFHDSPLVLQTPDSGAKYQRLVSAGPNLILETPRALDYPERAACGDDEVLYITQPDRRP